MAAWRFYHNPSVAPKILARPLLDAAAQAVAAECDDYVLAVHDWSDLDFRSPTRKRDRMILGQAEEIGYELHTCLLVSDSVGDPLAPVYPAVKSSDGQQLRQAARSVCGDEPAPRKPRTKHKTPP